MNGSLPFRHFSLLSLVQRGHLSPTARRVLEALRVSWSPVLDEMLGRGNTVSYLGGWFRYTHNKYTLQSSTGGFPRAERLPRSENILVDFWLM